MNNGAQRLVRIPAGDVALEGNLRIPDAASGLVVFAHGSGSSRFSPRNRFVAGVLEEAGLPKGVLNVVVGNGREVGGELAENAGVVALSFTGSYPIGRQIYLQLAQRMARAQMEMGGKNPTLVLADADLDLAATLVTKAGFGLTGQACTATSRAIVERSVLEPFVEKLSAKARALKVGNGLASGVEMGPAVNQQERDQCQHGGGGVHEEQDLPRVPPAGPHEESAPPDQAGDDRRKADQCAHNEDEADIQILDVAHLVADNTLELFSVHHLQQTGGRSDGGGGF